MRAPSRRDSAVVNDARLGPKCGIEIFAGIELPESRHQAARLPCGASSSRPSITGGVDAHRGAGVHLMLDVGPARRPHRRQQGHVCKPNVHCVFMYQCVRRAAAAISDASHCNLPYGAVARALTRRLSASRSRRSSTSPGVCEYRPGPRESDVRRAKCADG